MGTARANRAVLLASDTAFSDWLRQHPNSFVLNVRSRMSPDYLVLHRSFCSTIQGSAYSPGALTERGYRKVGADTPQELEVWISEHVSGATTFTRRCSRCGAARP